MIQPVADVEIVYPPGTTGGPDPHAYYDTVRARPDARLAYSLRDWDQIETYRHVPRDRLDRVRSTYEPETDEYHSPQDGVKFQFEEGWTSMFGNQVRLRLDDPIGSTNYLGPPATYVVTWDAWWGPEFLQLGSDGLRRHKAFQIRSRGGIWFEVRTTFTDGGPDVVGSVDCRGYGAVESKGSGDRFEPQAHEFLIQPSTWTRFWARVALGFGTLDNRDPDTYSVCDLWVADETRDAVPLLSGGRQYLKDHNITTFDLELNSSQNSRPLTEPPLTLYVRNMVALETGDLATLFQRPG